MYMRLVCAWPMAGFSGRATGTGSIVAAALSCLCRVRAAGELSGCCRCRSLVCTVQLPRQLLGLVCTVQLPRQLPALSLKYASPSYQHR